MAIMIGFTTGEEQTGSPNKHITKSILEEYPDYDFDLADIQLSITSKIFVLYAIIPIFWGALLVFLIMGTIGRLNDLKTRKPHIKYIQKMWKCRSILFIVDENRKWGLISNNNFKLLIEPQYDSMKWVKRNKLIEVQKGNTTFLIDINNNICI